MKIDENSVELRRLVKNDLKINEKRKNEWMGKEEAIVSIKSIYDNRIMITPLSIYTALHRRSYFPKFEKQKKEKTTVAII